MLLLAGAMQGMAAGGAAEDGGRVAVPRFKWGQVKDRLFLTVVVKEMEKPSVRVDFSEDRVVVQVRDLGGRAFTLDAELVHDILPSSCRWEHLPRRDRWGDAIVLTLHKVFPMPWEALLLNPTPAQKQAMDRDWAREEQSLEQMGEDLFFLEHAKYLPKVTEKSLAAARTDVDALVVLVRHAACEQCKVADDTFATAARLIYSSTSGWKSRVHLVVADAREQAGRRLARRLGARCASLPTECRHFALPPSGELLSAGLWDGAEDGDALEPVGIRGRHNQAPLLADLRRLARPQFRPISAEEAFQGRAASDRGLLVLAGAGAGPAGAAAPEAGGGGGSAALAAHRARLRVDTAVAEDIPAARALGLLPEEGAGGVASALLWQPGEEEPERFYPDVGGESQDFEFWLRSRSMPLLAKTSKFEEDEPYEELGLPVARLFLNGSTVDEEARAAVTSVARSYIGRVAFFVRNATAKSHEWRQHGLPPGRSPSLGLALSMQHNASKFGFLAGTEPATPEAMAAFWREDARPRLTAFLDDVLEGRLEPSKMSEIPPEDALPSASGADAADRGRILKLVGRTCRALVQESPTEALVEAYDEWRRDHKWRTLRLDLLAPMLARFNITVYRLDLSYNECPPDGLPTIPAGYSGYYFVPRRAKERGKKFQKLKKLDPPFQKVLAFLDKHTEARPRPNISTLLPELEAAAASVERLEAVRQAAGDRRTWAAAAAAGALGFLGFFALRRRARCGPSSPSASCSAGASSAARADGEAGGLATAAEPSAASAQEPLRQRRAASAEVPPAEDDG